MCTWHSRGSVRLSGLPFPGRDPRSSGCLSLPTPARSPRRSPRTVPPSSPLPGPTLGFRLLRAPRCRPRPLPSRPRPVRLLAMPLRHTPSLHRSTPATPPRSASPPLRTFARACALLCIFPTHFVTFVLNPSQIALRAAEVRLYSRTEGRRETVGPLRPPYRRLRRAPPGPLRREDEHRRSRPVRVGAA